MTATTNASSLPTANSDAWNTVRVFIVLLFLFVSGLVNGIHFALMAMDMIELRCMKESGLAKEKRMAAKILPIRERTNYLLASLAMCTTACDAITTTTIASLTDGVWPFILSTVLVTTFCNILPEALVFRFSGKMATNTIPFTYLVLIVAFPIAYPLSLLLNVCVRPHAPVRNRKYLKAYIEIMKRELDLKPFEVEAIKGALSLNSKIVRQIMTPIDTVLSLPESETLDWQTFVKILKTGFSRIPIYRRSESHVVGLLHIKEIALVFGIQRNIRIPVRFIMEKAPRPLNFVSAETSLCRETFVQSLRSGMHLAFVVDRSEESLDRIKETGETFSVNNSKNTEESKKKEGSNRNKVIGIVTLEDMIESVIGQEINDESDLQKAKSSNGLDSSSERDGGGSNSSSKRKGMMYAKQIIHALDDADFRPDERPIP